MQSTNSQNQMSFALALLLLAVVACACPNTNDNRRSYNTNTNTQPASSPTSTKPSVRLSKNELEQSFRQMLASNFSCFDYVKTKWDRVSGENVLSGAPTGAKDWCVEYLPRISWDDEKKHADEWVAENSDSLVAAKVTHVNIFYCTDPYGRSCHFVHAIAVK